MPFVLGAALALLGLVLMLLAVINELGRKQGGKAKQLFERDNLKRLFTVAATLLTLDRNRFKLLGAPATTISPYRYVKVCFPLVSLEKENALVGAGELAD